MIAPPLNDHDCLGKLTEVAAAGIGRADVRDLAARFATTAELAAWLRTLPQRNDDGDPADGPRVACDVPQRARLVAGDPNCVERSILYLAAGQVIDPRPVRQLATLETPRGSHTFPVEDGEPVVLDPAMPRNALGAGLWWIRNGGRDERPDEIDPAELLAWVADMAENAAEDLDGPRGRERVRRARFAFAALLDGAVIGPRDRANALYTLRLAGEWAPLYGEAGLYGMAIARRAIARLCATRCARNARVNPERVGYWTGKALATYYGGPLVGGPIYDAAYAEARGGRRGPRGPPSPADRSDARSVDAPTGDASRDNLAGSLNALEPKGGK